jgi:hypothetical protein
MTDNAGEQGFSESEIAALQAELEDSLAAGLVPDGWNRKISWDASDANLHAVGAAVFIVGSAVVCGWAWGWKAGLAALFVAVGLRILPAVRGGPRVGQTITESFTPPDETLLELGIAGHRVFDVTRSRPSFSRTRVATRADRTTSRRVVLAISAACIIGGTLTLLEESHAIGPVAYLRAGSLLGAGICAGFAVWIWRQYGRLMPLLDPSSDADAASLSDDVLDTATTGSTSDAVGTALLSRLPPKSARVLLPALTLLFGALSVLVAFNVTPDRSQLWSGLAAAVELTVFVLAGIRAVLLVVVSGVKRDWTPLGSALWMVALMAVLLLAAKLFGWLDDWEEVISWVRAQLD